MKAIEYRRAYGTDDELYTKFGELLHEEDTADSWEVESAHLFKDGDKYNLLFANGCSCWDGDYDGWSFTEEELVSWASKYDRGDINNDDASLLVANWVKENIYEESELQK